MQKIIVPFMLCVSLYYCAFTYLSSSCYAAPLFFQTTDTFIVIMSINPDILAVSASPFHTSGPAEISDISTAWTEDVSGKHTKSFHLALSSQHFCDYDWTLLSSCNYTAGKENPFHACHTVCIETLMPVSKGRNSSVTSAERVLGFAAWVQIFVWNR